MSFDEKKMAATATNRDVAAVAINFGLALSNIAFALEAARDGNGARLNEEVKKLRAIADDMDELFNRLTGYSVE
jgi:hypothetical protein